MTRKDFIVIAEILAKCTVNDKDGVERILKGTNPNFNASKFWDYVEKMKK